MIAEVARLLHENKVKLPFGLYITNSVQEEGIAQRMITKTIKPNVAIVTDVCHDHYSMIDKKIEGETKLGKGLLLLMRPVVQNNPRELIWILPRRRKSVPTSGFFVLLN
jgi:putative aminopeptidase FrvX